MSDDFPRVNGRPMVKPARVKPGAPELLPYRRVSHIGSMLEDRFWLELWQAKQAVIGAQMAPQLVDTSSWDSAQLARLTEVAGGHAKRDLGSAVHDAAEKVELGLATVGDYAGDVRVLLEKHLQLVSELDLQLPDAMPHCWASVEARVVLDHYQLAGTLDRIYEHPEHGLIVADLKTGSTVSPLATSVQIAAYALGRHYKTDTGRRGATLAKQGVNQRVGLVLHVPLAGPAKARYVDLAHGRDALWCAMEILRHRERAAWL